MKDTGYSREDSERVENIIDDRLEMDRRRAEAARFLNGEEPVTRNELRIAMSGNARWLREMYVRWGIV
jgi:hypothetical protein